MDKITDVSTSLAQEESDHWLQKADPPSKRIDLLIDPKSKQWAGVHKFFTMALESEKPIKDVIRQSFTHHQYRMLAPAERADVKEMQAANTRRYNALLAGRYKGVEDSLATKLTMMYFGLPVAPIDNVLEEIAMMMGLDENEVPRYNFKPPLHFLTAHDRRNWGNDTQRPNTATNHPLPLPRGMEPTLGLRGGDSDYPIDTPSDDYVPEDETPASFNDGWTYLYGLYGRLPFVPRKWRSFSKVLRQLLQADDHEEKVFSILWYDLEVGKPNYIHDQLPLTVDSPAMKFIHQHFADSTKSHKDCCVLFADDIHTEPNKGPQHWEPIPGQLQTDTVRIGRSLGHAPNGPETEVISYAYMAFPKTKTSTFDIGKYGCNQYNAHFSKTLNVLFGAPNDSKYHHALFHLYDKNRPDSHWTVPIVYGAIGLPQWVWELLYPLNSPDACWMVECRWLDFGMEAILMPNYYPDPNPYLVTQPISDIAAPFHQAYRQICEITAEAFDASDSRKIDSVFLVDGFSKGESRIDGFQVKPQRDVSSEDEIDSTILGKKLEQSPNFYRTVLAHWRPGHCRLFPSWYTGGDISVEMPRLTSTANQFFEAIKTLCGLVAPPNLGTSDIYFLLKEIPVYDTIQVQDMDSPSYFISGDATDDEWHDIRKSITSHSMTVTIVDLKKTDWATSISRSNLWGLRLDQETLREETSAEGGSRLDALYLQDDDGQAIDTLDGYPSDPVPIKPIDPNDDISSVSKEGVVWSPMSRHRLGAFMPPKLLEISQKDMNDKGSLQFPSTHVIEGASTPDGEPEHDIGILATSQPQFLGFPARVVEHEDSDVLATSRVVEENTTDDLFGESNLESGLAENENPTDDLLREEDPKSGLAGKDDLTSDPTKQHSGQARLDGIFFEPFSREMRKVFKCFKTDHATFAGSQSDKDDDDDDDSDKDGDGDGDEDGDGDGDERMGGVDSPRLFPQNKPEDELGNTLFSPASKSRGPHDRAHTWATQPSIFTTDDQRAWPADVEIGMPSTAPSVEKIYRLSANVPMYSKAILTPTEQAELQNGFWNLRNMILKRTNMCPFKGCSFTWRLDQDEELNIHVWTVHAKQKCPFCDEALFVWWSKDQKIKHIRDNHPDEVKKMISHGVQGGNSSSETIVNAPAQSTTKPPQQKSSGAPPGPAASLPSSSKPSGSVSAPANDSFVKGNVYNPFKKQLSALSIPKADKSVASKTTSLQAAVPQTTPPQVSVPQANTGTSASTFSQATQVRQQLLVAERLLKKCAYFEKCGSHVGSMTRQQYRRHIRQAHPKEISLVSSDEEEETDKEEGSGGGDDSDGDSRHDGDHGRDGGDKKASVKARPLKPAPKPTPKPPPKQTQVTLQGSIQEVIAKASSDPDEMDLSSDTQSVNAESSGSKSSVVIVPKKPRTTRTSTPKTPSTANESEADEQSERSSTVSRGKSSGKKPKSKRTVVTITADVDDDMEDDEGNDDDAGGSGSKSSNTVGRGRSGKKVKKSRPKKDNDGEYEDDGYETNDMDEGNENEERVVRRRAKSPDWVKKLGPEDPNFDPDDKMYCSKCLRKAPKRRTKSPNRSPIGRASEVQSHTDKNRCCRIRNAIGSADSLPNRSGWIPASKLPTTLKNIKDQFLDRFPTYTRTIYPTQSQDHHASVWRSDPNNKSNEEWWDIPWPPYEGLPPFPGTWEAPGIPWDDTPAGRRRRAMYIGNRVVDPNYVYQTDSDPDDQALQPDVDDIADFQSDMSAAKKRSASDADDVDDTDEPPQKKAKSSKTAASKTLKVKGTKKSRNTKSAQSSKTTSRRTTRSRTASASASAAPSAAASEAEND
ncbi:transaldolase [Fusarium longipes]|uniref:Transaldolase n=1 Tax=Fusarium longipes TaxID=694270 RepID=A0A395TB30_9HYPO|nr:transaldolase [Fusarium longipes]